MERLPAADVVSRLCASAARAAGSAAGGRPAVCPIDLATCDCSADAASDGDCSFAPKSSALLSSISKVLSAAACAAAAALAAAPPDLVIAGSGDPVGV